MENILPKAINEITTDISPTTTIKASIFPQKNQLPNVTISNGKIVDIENIGQTSNSDTIKILSTVAVVVLIIYGCLYYSFIKKFEDEWFRTEAVGGSYYDLVLDIQDGEIKYRFESWLLNSTIATYDYIIIAPGMVLIDNNWNEIVFVEINKDMMTIEPSLTSADSREYWFK